MRPKGPPEPMSPPLAAQDPFLIYAGKSICEVEVEAYERLLNTRLPLAANTKYLVSLQTVVYGLTWVGSTSSNRVTAFLSQLSGGIPQNSKTMWPR